MTEDTSKRDPGSLRGDGLKVCIVASRFNDFIVAHLVDGAEDGLVRLGVARRDINVIRAPGAFELPALCRRAAASRAYDVVIALGCVIRGATPHFDYVAGECAKGIASVAFEASLHGTAVIFGVLTTNTIEQAVERAGTKAGNKGFDAALAAVETVRALRAIPIQEPR